MYNWGNEIEGQTLYIQVCSSTTYTLNQFLTERQIWVGEYGDTDMGIITTYQDFGQVVISTTYSQNNISVSSTSNVSFSQPGVYPVIWTFHDVPNGQPGSVYYDDEDVYSSITIVVVKVEITQPTSWPKPVAKYSRFPLQATVTPNAALGGGYTWVQDSGSGSGGFDPNQQVGINTTAFVAGASTGDCYFHVDYYIGESPDLGWLGTIAHSETRRGIIFGMNIAELSFTGDHAIYDVAKPNWTSADTKPAAYTKNQPLSMNVKFAISTTLPSATNVFIKADGPGDLDALVSASISGNTASISGISTNTTLANFIHSTTVDFAWSFSSDSSHWCSAGSSEDHVIYVLYGAPLCDNDKFTVYDNFNTFTRENHIPLAMQWGKGGTYSDATDIPYKVQHNIPRNPTQPGYKNDPWLTLVEQTDCTTHAMLMREALKTLGIYAEAGNPISNETTQCYDMPYSVGESRYNDTTGYAEFHRRSFMKRQIKSMRKMFIILCALMFAYSSSLAINLEFSIDTGVVKSLGLIKATQWPLDTESELSKYTVNRATLLGEEKRKSNYFSEDLNETIPYVLNTSIIPINLQEKIILLKGWNSDLAIVPYIKYNLNGYIIRARDDMTIYQSTTGLKWPTYRTLLAIQKQDLTDFKYDGTIDSAKVLTKDILSKDCNLESLDSKYIISSTKSESGSFFRFVTPKNQSDQISLMVSRNLILIAVGKIWAVSPLP